MFYKCTFFLLLLSLPLITFAHGGHGFFQSTELAHYLTSPLHAIPIFFILAAGYWRFLKKEKSVEIF